MENIVSLNKGKVNRLPAIDLPSSKSISNRLLIIKALSNEKVEIQNLSDSDDTKVLQEALKNPYKVEVDIGHAGTAMRFLIAYYAVAEGEEHILTGSKRMQKRPVAPLVNALRSLGADIEYLSEEGYPPLRLKGRKLKGGKVILPADISSQYISALLLIAPALEGRLEIELKGEIVSHPYIHMTSDLIGKFGVNTEWKGNTLVVEDEKYKGRVMEVEADWSAASFFYEIMALSDLKEIMLQGLKESSLQGDKRLKDLYTEIGIETHFQKEGALLQKAKIKFPVKVVSDLTSAPDLIQPWLCTLAGLGIKGEVRGVQTLRIKETDRVLALKQELKKMGVELKEKDQFTVELLPSLEVGAGINFNTYNDHRMAMAFSPLTFKLKEITVENPEVVTKSFPGYWKEIQKAGVDVLMLMC